MKKVTIFFVLFITIPLLISAADYGSMYITNNGSSQSAGTSYTTITGYTEMASSGCTYATNGITTDTDVGDKQYLIRYSLSFYGSAALWSFGVSIASGTPRGIIERRIGTTGTDVGNAAGSFIATIPAGTKIVLQIKNDDTGTTDFTPVHSQLVVVELSESSTPKYGEMSIVNNTTVQTSITTFTNLANFINDYSNLEGWAFGTNTLTASTGSDGTYLVILSASFNGALSTSYELGVSVGSNEPYGGSSPTEIVLKRSVGSADIGNGGACGILSIAENDQISVQVKSAGLYIVAQYASLTLVKIADNNTPPYAGMKVEDNNNQLTLTTMGTWYPESDYAQDILNGTYWEFNGSTSNDELNPISLSAGDYLINYYLSVKVATKESETKTFNTLFALYNNGSRLHDLTTERTLERKQTSGNNPDVAAINGTAIIRIENPDDGLYMQIQSANKDDADIIVRYSNVNLFRLKTKGDGTLPVELSTFTGQYINNVPTLYWQTQSETDNMGWFVYRNEENDFTTSDKISEFIEGHGTTTQQQTYIYEDSIENPQVGDIYYYWLESIDYSGMVNHYDRVAVMQIQDIHNPEPHIAVPSKYGLQSGPNPFNSNLTVSYMLPKTDMVRIGIYNMYGQLIAQFNEGLKTADKKYTLEWDGKDIYGQNVSSGVLLIKLITSEGSETKKAILLR